MKYITLLFFILNLGFAHADCAQPNYCNRSCWDPEGNSPPESNPTFTNPTHIIVHHTGDGGFPENTDYKEIMQFYWDLHVNTNGWDDIGYNWLIDPDGIIYEGRGNTVMGAHFSCMSSNTTGISLIGNFQTEIPTTDAMEALQNLIAWEATDKEIAIDYVSYHISSQLYLENLAGHRDGNDSPAPHGCPKGTVCPGTNLYNKLPDLQNSVSNLSCYDVSPPSFNCSDAIALTCGVLFSGESSNAASEIYSYGCNNWTETGPERIHTITPSQNGTLTATIFNFTGDLDVYILGSCNPEDCLGSVESSSAVYENAEAGETYYIVVDADDGSGSSYDLLVNCLSEEETQDISVSNITATPTDVEPGQTIQTSTDLEYSGSQTSEQLMNVSLTYYLSLNCGVNENDILLEKDEVNPGSDFPEITHLESIIIPEETNTGSYYLLAIADKEHELPELYETNNTACAEININNTTALSDFQFESQLNVYPNPVMDQIYLENKTGLKINKMMLFNSSGLLLKEAGEAKTLSVQEFPAGLYILKVVGEENQSAVFKVVKE